VATGAVAYPAISHIVSRGDAVQVPGTIRVSDTACAPGWVAPSSGRHLFSVRDTSRRSVFAVELVGADQVSVYGEVELLAPGTTVPLDTVLPPGQYSFACENYDGETTYSTVGTVKGPAVAGAHPYVPVDFSQVQLATSRYRAGLLPGMRRLVTDTGKLLAAVDGGDLATARRAWLPAHLDYARLGAAYDTFGNFNTEIDGRPNGLPGGVHDSHFEGFLRLEYGLWHGLPAAELKPIAARLDAAVRGLLQQFPQMLTPANDLSLRTHEILENTLQFELTGETDEGSHTNLATAFANVQGTEAALAAIAPLLALHDRGLLEGVSAGLRRLASLLGSYEHPNGTWTPLEDLTRSQREHLDATVGSLLEELSPIPDLLELPVQPDTATGG
jgi:high-affinity iron transporter